MGTEAHLIDDASEIQPSWLEHAGVVGIAAGASAPENLVQDVVSYFKVLGAKDIQEVEVARERVTFTPPPMGAWEPVKHGVES